MKYKSPDEVGWSIDSLENFTQRCEEWNVAAMMVIYRGNVLFSYGDVARRFDSHSIRKSMLNSLYGIYVGNGVIDVSKTLDEINIDDKFELTNDEKSATVEDLLKSQSGIYLPAVGETESMKNNRPQRGSHPRNTHFYYNNWDFNTLATIFMQETHKDLYNEFFEAIATPLNMEDFRLIDGAYSYDSTYTYHPQYPFKMSARDMARFGLLYQKEGKWNNKQIISTEWIAQSTHPYYNNQYWGYGYLWWTCNQIDSTIYEASGLGGQKIIVMPKNEIVIVILNNTYKNFERHKDIQFIKMIQTAQVSQPSSSPELIPLEIELDEILKQRIEMTAGELKKYAHSFKFNKEELKIEYTNHGLIYDEWYRLIPLSKTIFFAEDIEQLVTFEFDSDGIPIVIDIKYIDE
jgi:hypothetical protein